MRGFSPNSYMRHRRRLRGLGYPIIPDQFTTAAGVPEAFSPKTPDATVVQILQSQGQQLPAALASAMAAGAPSTTYVAPNQLPVSSSVNVAPGVWQWTRVDGTKFYGDASGNPVGYTPSAVTPSGGVIALPPTLNTPPTTPAPVATTPASSPAAPPVAFVGPSTPAPQPAVTPAGAPISSTTGTPTSGTVVSSVEGELDSIMTWLKGSMLGGIPNWLLVGGAVAGLMMFGDDGSSRRRR